MNHSASNSLGQQRGAVLMVSLIVLLVITLMGVSAARTVLLEEKMTFASRDAKLALEVAESAVKVAVMEIYDMEDTSGFGTQAYGHLHNPGEGPADLQDPEIWGVDATTTQTKSASFTMAGHTLQGRYYIELGDTVDDATLFRIVAQGRGLSDTTARTLIVHYKKKF
ncbi:hypothetical protein Maes01_01621 [Microbulbifer aestuariivivens]|uniref:Type 4 fimbrial biogenesis protein PilX N-terminal domain-containing protein n=1 Tax=Microbulbifer aestuariivivens TaxID=1908308 RepID=A0ABP9WPE3_9GAMM